MPYIYSPVYEGGECSPNVYLPRRDAAAAGAAGDRVPGEGEAAPRRFYLIGDDYVWPRKVQRAGEEIRRRSTAARSIGEEYVPFGAPNKFEEVGHAHQGGQARRGDRSRWSAPTTSTSTAPSPASASTRRSRACRCCSKRTRCMGIGAENSANLYSCMGYFANSPSEARKAFKAEYFAKYGDKAPQLATIGADCYSALNLAQGAVRQGGRRRRQEAARRRRRAWPSTRASGRVDDARPAGRQGHVPGHLQGHASSRSSRPSRTSRAAPPARPESARRAHVARRATRLPIAADGVRSSSPRR